MDNAAMPAQLTPDGRALRAAATDLDKPVPTCPGWTVRDAVAHTATVYAHKSTIIEGRWTLRHGTGRRRSATTTCATSSTSSRTVSSRRCEGYSPGNGPRVAITATRHAWTITLGENVASLTRGAAFDPDATVSTTGGESALAALRALVAVATQ